MTTVVRSKLLCHDTWSAATQTRIFEREKYHQHNNNKNLQKTVNNHRPGTTFRIKQQQIATRYDTHWWSVRKMFAFTISLLQSLR